jgi:hypothetical protein
MVQQLLDRLPVSVLMSTGNCRQFQVQEHNVDTKVRRLEKSRGSRGRSRPGRIELEQGMGKESLGKRAENVLFIYFQDVDSEGDSGLYCGDTHLIHSFSCSSNAVTNCGRNRRELWPSQGGRVVS